MNSDDGDLEIVVAGESLLLLPERAVFWRAGGVLFVADPHFGKAATFRASGIAVPSGTTDDALTRLTSSVQRAIPKQIVFLGDLLHARAGRSRGMFDSLAQWKVRHPEPGLTLVRGNHDKHAGDPPGDLGIECVDSPVRLGPFVLAHHPVASRDGYVLAGHVHPAVRLYGAGRQRLRLPCFVFGAGVGVLPAFGDFTGFADQEPESSSAVYVIAEGAVIPVK
jgi:DNA ligase-associated metallophosphoesterase